MTGPQGLQRSIVGLDASRALSAAPTGTEVYSTHLIRALLPRLQDHEVRLYCRQEPPPEVRGTLAGAEMRVIPFPRLWTHGRLSWEMVTHPPDLLVVPAHVVPLIHPRRTLVTVHDLGYRFFPEAHPRRQRFYLELSTRWSVHAADHVLVDSRATRDAVVAAYGVRTAKLTVAYPGFDRTLHPMRDPASLAEVRYTYGISGDYLLFMGRIQPRKNLTRLIAAFARILPKHPDLTLVLAGPEGWLTERIHQAVEAGGLSNHVLFPGYVAEADKAALISGARAFVYPSLYEGFGFPVLEAQSCGVPLLTSLTSSLPEVAGEGALLVDPLDVEAIAAGLERLLTDTGLRRALADAGTKNLARFSWERTGEVVSGVIRALLRGDQPQPAR